ncbi:gfo/Idh/MocA family oxidoreductase [Actinobacteria bacterium YIM 96077]|uniref:Gfo/Idh/MocA family oxidoreductase n=1 Tax=Phytoactinopolyspora halophila TaxID=1981511 RepID=A0A329QDF2_9ACTN|nr:Gfo/Idh/MocA family oxidoreductase [Phytoactinopolyspora halophila]AYY12446.1 gfo/Idh/MocA family oxidoreductase [Actinobacteria bacterium YIM 96077]RAW09272.1 gfo/Idh/MocA family oxidoreductase [Phytoactinopolyspora halophila]
MRVGFLSPAHVHADAYVANVRAAGADVVGVTDDDTKRGVRWSAEHGVPWMGSADELFDAGVDAVVVCSETAHHRKHVERAAAAGVAVLCEKPLATTEDDARAIVDTCTRSQVTLMTAFPMRFSPPLREVASTIASGTMGRLYACTGTNQGELPLHHGAWFGDPVLAGGGALMDHTVHVADILRWYLGQDPVEVYAVTNNLLHREATPVETGALVMLTYADGFFATIDASWSRPPAYPTWGGLTVEFVGEHGVVDVDAFSQQLTIYGGTQNQLSWLPWGSDANQGLIDEFLAAVRERRTPAVTADDGLAATRVALAALRSAETGAPIPFSR